MRHIPENEIKSTLQVYPEIKDFVEMNRLKKYVIWSLNTKITSARSALAIGRVLQVIGECMPPETKDNFSFKRFLALCLPKDVPQTLKNVRKELSHLMKGHAFTAKIQSEKNFSLFQSTQREISQIEKPFTSAYHIITVNVNVYFALRFVKELLEVKNSMTFYTAVLEKLRSFPKLIFQKYKSSFYVFLQIALENLNKEVEEIRNESDAKDKVIKILWPVRYLSDLMQKCGLENAGPILDSLKKLEQSNSSAVDEIKKESGTFLTQCEEFMSNLVEGIKRKKAEPLESIKNIKYFLKILKGFYLSDEKFRNEIPEDIRESVAKKNVIIQSTDDGYSLDVVKNSEIFEITYFSARKIRVKGLL